MQSGIKNILLGLKEVLFPHVCEICGHLLSMNQSFVCQRCLVERFEESPTENKEGISSAILPEGVQFAYSMWRFDKGGYLQDLLHKLKYNQLQGVGTDLGKQLGSKLLEQSGFKKNENWMLVPVPLHHKKERKRGFNQARIIAEGISKSTSIELISKGSIKRIKNTKTQTGFTLQKRNENIQKAFRVEAPSSIEDRSCIIVDDVFTTGATTFELANSMKQAGCRKIIIATVASA